MRDFAKYKDSVYEVIGAAMDVYNELGFGLRETVYQEALALELNSRGILCERQKEVHIYYKGEASKQKVSWNFVLSIAHNSSTTCA